MNLQTYLAENPKKHLIFDFDETLFTLLLPWEKYIKELTQKLLDFDPTLAEFSQGKILNDVENEAVRRWGEPAMQIRRTYSEQFESTFLTGAEEHSELTAFVKDNHKHFECSIWTSNMRTTIMPILQKNALDQCFKKIVTKSDVSFTKPNPEGFESIFDSSTQKKTEYLMIGDSQNDRGAAQNAEIDFFHVTD
jgi:phosphoglycolate phosphatase-like HAD superfamily hydrolase